MLKRSKDPNLFGTKVDEIIYRVNCSAFKPTDLLVVCFEKLSELAQSTKNALNRNV